MKRISINSDRIKAYLSAHSRRDIYDALIIGVLIFLLSLLGIFTRPTGLLAAFWPANAVLLGLFVRAPRYAKLPSWLAALLGYLSADILTGGSWSISLAMAVANLVGVITGYLLFSCVSPMHRRLARPLSIIYLILIVLAAAFAACLVGRIATTLLFDVSTVRGMFYWAVDESVNYLSILPAILTAPEIKIKQLNMRRRQIFLNFDMQKIAALLSLLLGLVLGYAIGGPGAISFIFPGLLWCAVSFGLFISAVLILISSTWVFLGIGMGYLQVGLNTHELFSLESFRLGVTFTLLAPLIVASTIDARNELVNKLQYTAYHDSLTGILNRIGFAENAVALFNTKDKGDRSITALMLDVDYFKKVNDVYGHASGDLVLLEFSKLVANCLRETDIVGRLGGEEFAVLLAHSSYEVAQAIAQRICDTCANHKFTLSDNTRLKVTVSIGLAYSPFVPSSLDKILGKADIALYEAKGSGRNRVLATLYSESP